MQETSDPKAISLMQLVRIAAELLPAADRGPLSDAERKLLHAACELPAPDSEQVENIRAAILAGRDPLGEALSKLRTLSERRSLGQFWTPQPIVDTMVEWVLAHSPAQVVDAGAGTGRFAAAVLRCNPRIPVHAVELDPVASLLCRAHLAQLPGEATVHCTDYLNWAPPVVVGPTAFLGNPPYVRHHALSSSVKAWLDLAQLRLGRPVSKLAGLHAYFLIATSFVSKPGDLICFITSAEWLDVRYGEALRWLLLERLGLESLHLLTPEATAFPDAMTTAVIVCCRVGQQSSVVRVRRVEHVDAFTGLSTNGVDLARDTLAAASRWSPLVIEPKITAHQKPVSRDDAVLPLGNIARVHRGIATGANSFFVLSREEAEARGLLSYCVPCITRAEQILVADGLITAQMVDEVLLLIPPTIPREQLPQAVETYLREGEEQGVHLRYLCRHRRPWWSLGRPKAPPIVMTYMARRPPAFALNPDGLVPLNIAHGIYPIQPLAPAVLRRLVQALNDAASRFYGNGRTYQGGLVKFEPREVEQLLVPRSSLETGKSTAYVATMVRSGT